jgi:hypothetical protein
MADTAVVLGDALLSPQQLADYLGVPLASVYRWRYEGTGPRGIKVGQACPVSTAGRGGVAGDEDRPGPVEEQPWLGSASDPDA